MTPDDEAKALAWWQRAVFYQFYPRSFAGSEWPSTNESTD
jgi:hypothetical protein